MRPCPSCGCHVRGADRACPACRAPLHPTRTRSAAALLLGLSVACVGGTTTDDKATDSDTPTDTYTSPDYGVAYTDYGDADTDTDSDTDVDTDADTDTAVPAHSGHSGGSHSSSR